MKTHVRETSVDELDDARRRRASLSERKESGRYLTTAGPAMTSLTFSTRSPAGYA